MRLNVGIGFGIIALAFPVLELVGIYHLWQAIGAWTLVWFALAILLGWGLMLHVQTGWALQLMGALQSGSSPWRALTAVGLRFLAGLLFIIPGPVSDVLGLGLLLASLLVPAAAASRGGFDGAPGGRAVDPGVIDGEWQRVDDPALSHDFIRDRGPSDSVK